MFCDDDIFFKKNSFLEMNKFIKEKSEIYWLWILI